MASERHAIFIRTYHKDADRLFYCLLSIRKFCEGFDEVIVVCPPSSLEIITNVLSKFPEFTLKITREYQRDYLGQQRDKLTYFEFSDADYVHHVDSDCVFYRKYTPSSLFKAGLPVLFHIEYDYFYRNRILMPWQLFTSRAALRQIDLEFMAMLPLIYPRALCVSLNTWIDQNHDGIDMLLDRSTNQYEFSEFNLIGAASYYKFFGNTKFHTHLNWGMEEPDRFLIQFCLTTGHIDRSIRRDELHEIHQILEYNDSSV